MKVWKKGEKKKDVKKEYPEVPFHGQTNVSKKFWADIAGFYEDARNDYMTEKEGTYHPSELQGGLKVFKFFGEGGWEKFYQLVPLEQCDSIRPGTILRWKRELRDDVFERWDMKDRSANIHQLAQHLCKLQGKKAPAQLKQADDANDEAATSANPDDEDASSDESPDEAEYQD